MNNLNFNTPSVKIEAKDICFYLSGDEKVFSNSMLNQLKRESENAPWLSTAIDRMAHSVGQIANSGNQWSNHLPSSEITISASKICELFINNLPMDVIAQEKSALQRILNAVASAFIEIGCRQKMLNLLNQANYADYLSDAHISVYACMKERLSVLAYYSPNKQVVLPAPPLSNLRIHRPIPFKVSSHCSAWENGDTLWYNPHLRENANI